MPPKRRTILNKRFYLTPFVFPLYSLKQGSESRKIGHNSSQLLSRDAKVITWILLSTRPITGRSLELRYLPSCREGNGGGKRNGWKQGEWEWAIFNWYYNAEGFETALREWRHHHRLMTPPVSKVWPLIRASLVRPCSQTIPAHFQHFSFARNFMFLSTKRYNKHKHWKMQDLQKE